MSLSSNGQDARLSSGQYGFESRQGRQISFKRSKLCSCLPAVRNLDFHSSNAGSNPVKNARLCCHRLIGLGHPPLLVGNIGSTPFDSTKHMSCSSNGLGTLAFNQDNIGSNPIQDTKLMLYSSNGQDGSLSSCRHEFNSRIEYQIQL